VYRPAVVSRPYGVEDDRYQDRDASGRGVVPVRVEDVPRRVIDAQLQRRPRVVGQNEAGGLREVEPRGFDVREEVQDVVESQGRPLDVHGDLVLADEQAADADAAAAVVAVVAVDGVVDIRFARWRRDGGGDADGADDIVTATVLIGRRLAVGGVGHLRRLHDWHWLNPEDRLSYRRSRGHTPPPPSHFPENGLIIRTSPV